MAIHTNDHNKMEQSCATGRKVSERDLVLYSNAVISVGVCM